VAVNSARNQDYALSLTTGLSSPRVRLTQSTFTQYAFTRWRRACWIGADPPAIRYDWNPRYLLSTGAYPNWDPDSAPSEQTSAARYAGYTRLYPERLTIPGFDDPDAAQGHGPGGIVNFNHGIDVGGDADWIGLANTWDVIYLLSGDPRFQKIMIDNADLAGRFPMWFREADHKAGSGHYFDHPITGKIDPYGHVVSINARQQVTLALFNWHIECPGGRADNINAGAPLRYGNWPSMDTSHMPDFGFIPCTLTGKYYYLEQVQLQAGYVAGYRVGCYDLSNNWWRQGYLGLLQLYVRDTAWSFRSLAYGAFVSPDGTPEQAYFTDKLRNNIALQEGEHGLTLNITDTPDRTIAYNYGKTTAGSSQASNPSPLGAWGIDPASEIYAQHGNQNNVNPNTLSKAGSMFQEAFLTCSLGLVRQLGVADTKPLLQFLAKRYLHTLLDPNVNHYLIEQYVYPAQLKSPVRWIADWSTFQNPSSWLNAICILSSTRT